MQVKYILRIRAIGRYPELILTKERYSRIKQAADVLVAAFAVEEKYEMLISNYLDFEKEVLSQSANLMLRSPCSYEEFYSAKTEFNRKLVNMLTTSRLYLDQVVSHCGEIIGGLADTEIRKLCSIEYDAEFHYRFMEALRNYVQHCGLPVHNTSFGSRLEDPQKNESYFVFGMEISTEKLMLDKDKKFKRRVLDEAPDKVDLKESVRVYMECLSRIHSGIRSSIKEKVKDSREIVEESIEEYREVIGKKPVGLCAMKIVEDSTKDYTPLLLDWDEVRTSMVKRNQSLVNLRRRYVSSRLKGA